MDEIATFALYVSYRQVCVFPPDLEDPFNDWTDAHDKQGFSWRPESVSFATLEQDGELHVIVAGASTSPPDFPVARAIRVPFTVPKQGNLEIASIEDSQLVQIRPGAYALTFATGFKAGVQTARFDFTLATDVQPAILVKDDRLDPRYPLLMEVGPAR